jgi:hypothetical protein
LLDRRSEKLGEPFSDFGAQRRGAINNSSDVFSEPLRFEVTSNFDGFRRAGMVATQRGYSGALRSVFRLHLGL